MNVYTNFMERFLDDLKAETNSLAGWCNSAAGGFPQENGLGILTEKSDKHKVDKHVFVKTKHIFCCDKSMLAATKPFLQQNYVCDKVFVVTNVCCDKHIFVVTKDMFCDKRHVLSQQTCVCCDKHMFVATKMILLAAPANNSPGVFHIHQRKQPQLTCPVRSLISASYFCSVLSTRCIRLLISSCVSCIVRSSC